MIKNKLSLPPVDLIVITGPTASGKTGFAAHLAKKLDGEILSADSRQVYRGMDLGTGKDYDDYFVDGKKIPYHLIDTQDPGTPYNVYSFQQDFLNAFADIKERDKQPILCGGTGLYIEAVLKGYRLIEVPPDLDFQRSVEDVPEEKLIVELKALHALHNTSDTGNRKRLIRALEIARYYAAHPEKYEEYPDINWKIIGIRFDRASERKRITARLEERLQTGMLDEVARLLKIHGHEKIEYFGLEYKFVSQHLRELLTYDEMFQKLNTAIHQFSKRQMTWFRRMERHGFKIHWIDGYTPIEQKVDQAINYLLRQ